MRRRLARPLALCKTGLTRGVTTAANEVWRCGSGRLNGSPDWEGSSWPSHGHPEPALSRATKATVVEMRNLSRRDAGLSGAALGGASPQDLRRGPGQLAHSARPDVV